MEQSKRLPNWKLMKTAIWGDPLDQAEAWRFETARAKPSLTGKENGCTSSP